MFKAVGKPHIVVFLKSPRGVHRYGKRKPISGSYAASEKQLLNRTAQGFREINEYSTA